MNVKVSSGLRKNISIVFQHIWREQDYKQYVLLNGGSGVALRMNFLIPTGKMDENGVSGKNMAL